MSASCIASSSKETRSRTYLTARVATGIHDVTVMPTSGRSRWCLLQIEPRIVATVTHADGRHLERLEIPRDRWVTAAVAGCEPRPAAG